MRLVGTTLFIGAIVMALAWAIMDGHATKCSHGGSYTAAGQWRAAGDC